MLETPGLAISSTEEKGCRESTVNKTRTEVRATPLTPVHLMILLHMHAPGRKLRLLRARETLRRMDQKSLTFEEI